MCENGSLRPCTQIDTAYTVGCNFLLDLTYVIMCMEPILHGNLTMIRILFFDTSAVVKYFHSEAGSEVVRWIVNDNINISISVSKRVIEEFPSVIKKIAARGDITEEQAKKIMQRSKHYFRERFICRDSKPTKIPNSIAAEEYIEKHKLKKGKNDWDANHIACVYNHLRFGGGISTPRFITSDKRFIKLVESEGFSAIDPENTNITELSLILSHEPKVNVV